ncbi:C-terminal motor kinesin, putative [Trypanosoma cruzi marinkellei]|uniref:C-terminal motor kinesin, putative n=1 Tax=Trypanosoma cruzi marinkellei TaxID=85056 RepID=K2NHU8_TRYCR|nr:C-terminal motor kinesin, putative [Trypanosoma cruzi marinkellei]
MSSLPSHVRIVVRTRPTEFIADDFKILPNGALYIKRRMKAGITAALHAETKSGTLSSTAFGGGDGDGNFSPLASEAAGASSQDKLAFNSDSVLHNASQETVYDATTSELVESLLQGLNCTLLCYGQSGSGKTYTLFGGNTYPTRGCVPRAVHAMFESMAESTDHEFKVHLTFVEVHGDQLVDLLGKEPVASVRPGGKNNAANKVVVTLDSNGDVVLRGVEERQCASEAEALAAMFEGLQRRTSRSNSFSPHSSYSHAVLTFHVLSKSLLDSDALVHYSRFNFVDLAGIRRPTPTADEAARQEAKIINRSIMMFEQVILALSGPQPRHVPYRQSKLTMLLKDAIGGTSRTTLIATIWPEERHKELTLATLNFAKRLVRIESHPVVNASTDPEAQIRMLRRQVTSLKSELRMQDQLAGREAVPTAPLEPDEIKTARDQVMAFISGATPQVRVGCVREMHACFLAFKILLGECEAQLRDVQGQRELLPRPGSNTSIKSAKRKAGSKQHGTTESKENTKYVSSVEDAAAGVGVGTIERLSPVVREVFFQRQRSCSNASPTVLSGAKELSSDGYTPGHTPTPPVATNTTAPNNMTAAGAATSTFTTSGPATRAKASVLPLPEGEKMKMQAHSNRPSSCPLTEKIKTGLPPLEHEKASTIVSSSRFLGKRDTVLRDRRTAFEAYKRTSGGACQLEAIENARKLVAEKKEDILQLQKRVNEIRLSMEESKKSEGHHTPTMEEHANTRHESVDATHSTNAFFEGSHSVVENNVSFSESFSASPVEKFPHMKLSERKALLNLSNDALTRAMVESGVLERRFNRLCDAFMSNFQFWYQSQLQPQFLTQGEGAAGEKTNLDVNYFSGETNSFQVSIPHVAAKREDDARFVDAAERVETSNMQQQQEEQQEQQSPASAAFYTAQRLARRGLQLRE